MLANAPCEWNRTDRLDAEFTRVLGAFNPLRRRWLGRGSRAAISDNAGSLECAPMFLIPTGTDRDGGRRPLFVPLLVIGCVAGFLAMRERGSTEDDLFEHLERLLRFGLSYQWFEWWQPVTYQFMHGGWFHLISNMFFLAAFGVVLESRIGHLGFLILYLTGGAFAGLSQAWIGHWLAPSGDLVPIVGASGSVSALMGAAFALYPRANVRGIAIPQFVHAQTSLQWMMAFAVALDIARTIVDLFGGGHSGIATLAHLGGLLFGFGVGIALIGTGILKRDDFDALYLFRQWRRRREMRAAMLESGMGGDGSVAARVRANGEVQETESQRTLRHTIAAAHRERDYVLAAQLYSELLKTLPDATLPAAIQLDVANQLAQEGRNAQAAAAYGRFLERFRTHVASDDVRVMLAAIQARRLGDKAGARTTLDGFGTRELDRDRQALIVALRQECA